ncbi:hypothetical protein [Geomicrobium sp. JCM 19039]|nr:hypothetical protein [Geomicrobium sp. JCM 19039]
MKRLSFVITAAVAVALFVANDIQSSILAADMIQPLDKADGSR